MTNSIVRPARARAEAQKSKKKEARLSRAAKKLAEQAAVSQALRGRTRENFLARLKTALVSGKGFYRDLVAWHRVHHALLFVPLAERARVVDFVLAVEARAPGLCVLAIDEGRHDVVGRGVVNLGAVESKLHRSVTTFAPRARSLAAQWRELVAHTCFLFPSPPLLEACFFERGLTNELRALAAFIGGGGSWRKAPLTTTITRATAHLLSTSKVPAQRLSSAVRDAQAASVGVSPAHRAVLEANAAWHFDAARDELWLSLFAFLARHPEMANDDVKVVAEGVSSVDVSFSLRGRTPVSLVRELRVRLKNDELRRKGRTDVGALASCDVEGGVYALNREAADVCGRVFIVERIKDGLALVEEGIAMRHCVGTYADRAKEGSAAIFSLKVAQFGDAPRRALTIEVDPKRRRIEQVRGKANRAVDDDERAVILAWMRERGLTADPHAL